MEIRPADSEDRQRVETLARDSFRTSYALSPQQIETIVESEFDAETLAERLSDPDTTMLVAEHPAGDTEQVQGFIDVAVGEERTIRWLHVDPEARGEGIATALIDGVREDGDGTPLVARILEDAVEGGEFLEDFGLESDDNAHVTFGNEEFAVSIFTEGEGTADANGPTVPVPESVTTEGTDHPVGDEKVPGREAPFFSVYMSEDRTEQYGYFCSNCGSTDVSGDGLDRLECSECGNLHLADEWDDSYL